MTCKLNEQFALNTRLTSATIEEQNIVVLKADMTESDEEIEGKLVEFGNTLKAIPYYAVYRPGKQPHHFDGNFVTVGAKGFLDRAGIASDNPLDGELADAFFSRKALEEHLANGKSVLVYFGADWNVTSKFNEQSAINTEAVKAAVDRHGMVVLKADMTEENPEAEATLAELGNATKSVPYYVIYRPGIQPHHFGGNFVTVGAKGFLERAGLDSKADNGGVHTVKGEDKPESSSIQVADALATPAG